MQYVLRKFLRMFLLALLCLPAASFAHTPPPTLTKVRLQLKWHHQFQFAGFYAARELGFYRDKGLDVEIVEGGPEAGVLTAVTQGRAEFGILGSELLYHRARGRDVVVLAPIMQHSVRAIIARADKGIVSPHSLVGRTVMLNSNELPEFTAMFLSEGVEMDAIDIVEKNRDANARFISGQVDAINGSVANQPYLFRKENIPFTLIRPITYGVDFYGDTLFTTSGTAKNAPETVAAFLSASFEGWRYAFAHPEKITDLILEKYSRKKSKAHLMFEYRRIKELIHPELVQIGHNNPRRWQQIGDTYLKLGLIEEPYDLQGFFYSDYGKAETRLWITRLAWTLGIITLLFTLNFLWNFRLRRTVRKITDKIQESEENLRVTLNSIGDGVIATDLSGNITRMNPVAEHLTGWRLEDALGQSLSTVFHIIHSKTRVPAPDPVDMILSRGRVTGLATHTALLSKDGAEYQISDSGAPIRDSLGNTIGVVLVFQDMTDEYQSLEKIKTNEQKFRNYIAAAPHGIFVMGSAGTLLEVNPSLCHTSGYPEQALLGKDLAFILAGEDRERITELVLKAMEQGTAHGEARILTGDGLEKACEVDLVRIGSSGLLGFVRDISRRMAAETHAANLERFPSENPNPVLRISPEGILLYANKGSEKLLEHWGLGPGDRLPSGWHERIPDILKSKRLTQIEEEYAGRWVSLVATPVPEMNYVNIYGMDITALKEAEKHLQQALKMEAVGTISGGIAHDFNNILGIIIGNIELAMDELPLWNRARRNLEEIRTASLRARDVVRQLLSFSRKTEHLKKPLNLQPLIRESVKLLRSSTPASIDIRTDLCRQPMTIEADSTQIHQVLINLCTNAAHAMDENGGVLTIRLAEISLDHTIIKQYQEIQPGRYARLAITDTGHGIDPALRPKIFDPYFTTKDVGKGTGMGLAVVLGIVKSHYGDISVYSEPGRGTTFNVLLPLIDKKESPQPRGDREIPCGQGRILFVDDEPSMVKMGSIILGRLGYRVVTETDPLAALEKVKSGPDLFDLVITDMTMPTLTGDRLAREIIRIKPGLPIILCSGFSTKIDRERAREIGIFKYIEKPLNKGELARAVSTALKGKTT
ncbi:MAG: ABC transporter substrate-binding protein [Desulfobacter sp.]